MALISYIEFMKGRLQMLIEVKDYYLQDDEIIELSQYIDKLITVFQRSNTEVSSV